MENNFQTKKTEDYKEILHRCSKCGLCQKKCPVFIKTKNEKYLARGIVIMLRNVFNKKLKLKDAAKHIDNCIACTKCKDICPSEIDMSEISICIKKECLDNNKIKKVFVEFLQSDCVLGVLLYTANILRNLFIKKSKKFDKKAVFFFGCKTGLKKINKIIEKFNDDKTEIICINSLCCGLPYLKSGNIKQFEKTAKSNMNKIKDYDKVYFTCEKCLNVFNFYKQILNGDTDSKEFILFKDSEENL